MLKKIKIMPDADDAVNLCGPAQTEPFKIKHETDLRCSCRYFFSNSASRNCYFCIACRCDQPMFSREVPS